MIFKKNNTFNLEKYIYNFCVLTCIQGVQKYIITFYLMATEIV